jgi:hypothetical protein
MTSKSTKISAKWRIINKKIVHLESKLVISVKGKDTNKGFSREVCTWNKQKTDS